MAQMSQGALLAELATMIYQNNQGRITGAVLARFLTDFIDSAQFSTSSLRPAPRSLTVTATDTIAVLSVPFLATTPAMCFNGLLYLPPAFTLSTDGMTVTWSPQNAGSVNDPTHITTSDQAPLLIAL